MKNVQIIDGAENCCYSIFQFTDEQFALVFPDQAQDIKFIEDVRARLGSTIDVAFKGVWRRLVKKPEVNGIDGTLFYELEDKKPYYPNKNSSDIQEISG